MKLQTYRYLPVAENPWDKLPSPGQYPTPWVVLFWRAGWPDFRDHQVPRMVKHVASEVYAQEWMMA